MTTATLFLQDQFRSDFKFFKSCSLFLFYQIIPSVNEKDQLGHQLLPILGLRIKTILNSNVDYYSDFSPSVTTWIDSLVSCDFLNQAAKRNNCITSVRIFSRLCTNFPPFLSPTFEAGKLCEGSRYMEKK